MERDQIDRRHLLGGAVIAASGLAVSRPVQAEDRAEASEIVGRRRSAGTGGVVGPAVDSGALSTYLLVTPVRVYNSRSGAPGGTPDGTDPVTGTTDVPWIRGTERTIDIECVLGDTSMETGVPSTAAGVVMNITVVNIKAGGYLVAWAPDGSRPATANVNWVASSGVVNSLVMSRCADGYVSLYTMMPVGASVDVIVDVIGWLG